MGVFDPVFLTAMPQRIFGIMNNFTLLAIPYFIFMGAMLEKSGIAEDLLETMGSLFGRVRGGLAVAVVVVGALLAATTGVVAATVVTMGLISLPTMLRYGYDKDLASGVIAASGTLGQIIPPSIVLIVLGDQMSNAWQVAQTRSGNFAPDTVSVPDLFAGAILPGLILVVLFVIYQIMASKRSGEEALNHAPVSQSLGKVLRAFLPPLLLIVAVLGSILAGLATSSEAASVGAVGALVLARKRLSFPELQKVLEESVHLISMIFLIIIGATIFSLVFRGLGGEETITRFLADLPGGTYGAVLVVMLVIFILGFFLEFIEISFIVVPIVAPLLLAMPMADGSAMSPVWLGVLIALNLQTSFLTPPFGLSLFYLRSVVGNLVSTAAIYRGIIPFVLLQLVALGILILFPSLATIVPQWLYGG